jgi:hypothetical protein
VVVKRKDEVEPLKEARDSIAGTIVAERRPEEVVPTARATRIVQSLDMPATSEVSSPAFPDGAPVNETWDIRTISLPSGPRGLLQRLLRRALAPWIEAQVTFNSRQVQLDNELLEFVGERFSLTHRHYDSVLGIHGRHMEDIDKRHLILQEELVAHVHDLVKRIDLILEDAERNRLSLETTLRDVRTRLAALERRLDVTPD